MPGIFLSSRKDILKVPDMGNAKHSCALICDGYNVVVMAAGEKTLHGFAAFLQVESRKILNFYPFLFVYCKY